MTRPMTFGQAAFGGFAFLRYLALGGLFSINLEVTKRCNARCSFCNYWKESPPAELKRYSPIVRKLSPLSVSLTGGEPLLRNDLTEIILDLRRNTSFLFISLVTNGALLDYRRGIELWEAGLDELSVSLDYTDSRHDRDRGLKGLADNILSIVPALKKAGVNVCFNVVLKRENYRDIPDLIRFAADSGVKISLSAYNPEKADNPAGKIEGEDLPELKLIIKEIVRLKKRTRAVTSSAYYLERIPEFFELGGIPGCTAGVNWVQVTPDGQIKRCPDRSRTFPHTNWRKGLFNPTRCTSCWYSCRGAAQEPMSFSRFHEMTRNALLD